MNTVLTGFSLHEIMLLISVQKLTGELVLESGNNIGSIVFHEGRILHALSPYSRAIGDLLVEKGIITEAELLAALNLQKTREHEPIGFLFFKSGKVSLDLVEKMIHGQIRQSINDFNSWNRLYFNFIRKEIVPYDHIHLTVCEFLPPEMVANVESGLKHICTKIERSSSGQELQIHRSRLL